MDNDLDLSALRGFRTVLREGSFSAAALALRIPKSTLSKRVADLESHLGVRLIERSTRTLRATQEGEVLAARADRLLGEAEDIRRALGESGGTPRGHLRLAVPQSFGNVLLGAIAAGFRKLHPDVTLEVHFLDRAPDLLEEGFDGCIRFGPLEDSTQVARRLSHGQAMMVAAPDLPGLETLRHPQDLAHFDLVGLAAPWPGGLPLQNGSEEVVLPYQPPLRLGSHLAVRDAVVAGAGVAALPGIVARPDIAAGRLVRVLPDWSTPRKAIYFVYPSAQSVTARLRVFIDHLAQVMAED
ncbi:LysR family transcriptional regulator [Rhodobacter sp. SY28-1]|uniref:LysR family transcriptional regulator n=1 Tax=Rhodobacter sp. SY28-1 TaxID=2562317 RepID=UPI001484D4DD|nr:LysR family transcriptional regulator [Rhodobacter sp. SY28-1]